jgi:hypothetical protein
VLIAKNTERCARNFTKNTYTALNMLLLLNAVKSTDSDNAFDDKPVCEGQSIAATWRKRASLYCATDSPGSQSESDEVSLSIFSYYLFHVFDNLIFHLFILLL